jgi:hypothetical protein
MSGIAVKGFLAKAQSQPKTGSKSGWIGCGMAARKSCLMISKSSVRNALFVKPFELTLEVLLTFAQIRDVTLEQIKLPLQIDPTAYNQRGQEHQLHQNRDIYLAIQTPALFVCLSSLVSGAA